MFVWCVFLDFPKFFMVRKLCSIGSCVFSAVEPRTMKTIARAKKSNEFVNLHLHSLEILVLFRICWLFGALDHESHGENQENHG